MNQLVDTLVVFRILHVLLTPIEDSDAFHLGLVDKDGKQLRSPKTSEEKEAYSVLYKVAFKLKNIIKKNVNSEKDLKSLATSVHLIKECIERDIDPDNLEEIYLVTLNEMELDEINNFSEYIMFTEEAPVNAAGTPGIDGFTKDTLAVKKKQKILKRNKPTII